MRLRILLPVIVAGLASCSDEGPKPSWLVTTALSANAFSLGEPLVITIVAHNISSEVRHVNNVCVPQYLVLEAGGHARPLPQRICTALFILPRDIAPGDSVVVHDSWDGNVSSGYLKSVPAPPGLYLIEGRVFAPDEVRGSASQVLLK